MWIALAIVVCMVLHLVDRNQKWKTFWIVAKRTVIVVILLGILGGSYAWYHENRVRAEQGWEDYKPPTH